MAGTAGFEPANAGVKVQCLRPLGDVPDNRRINHMKYDDKIELRQRNIVASPVKLKASPVKLKDWQLVLQEAYNLIQCGGWGRGAMWNVDPDSDTRYGFCSLGAIRSTKGSLWAKFVARRKLRRAIASDHICPWWLPAFIAIPVWNDQRATGRMQVLNMFRKAIFND